MGVIIMTDPLVSVIIPAYNASRFISAAIESVLTQSYVNREVIVVDDGSTDGTGKSIQKYLDKILYIHQANSRQAVARNHGIRYAKGELIAFLDADDVWLPDKLKQQVQLFRQNPELGLVYCKIREIDETGSPIRDSQADLRGADTVSRILLGKYDTIGTGSTSLIPRVILDEVGLFDPELPPCEDTDMLWRIASRRPIDYVNEVFVLYRMHPGNSHRNLHRTTRAWIMMYQKALNDPLIRNLGSNFRRECLERLYYMVAGDCANAGYWGKAFWYAFLGSTTSPRLIAIYLQKILKKITRHDKNNH